MYEEITIDSFKVLVHNNKFISRLGGRLLFTAKTVA